MQLGDSMSTNLASIMAAEEKAVHSFGQLVKAKTAEVDSLTEAIEKKTTEIGELGVYIVELKDDIDDLAEGLLEDEKFLKELTKGCETKDAEWDERKKMRAAELLALKDTIKILNDDDALELFKKTLPAPSSASLVQVATSAADMRARALRALASAPGKGHRAELNFIAMAIKGK